MMRISNLNNNSSFFTVVDSVCKYPYGATAAVTQNTDTFELLSNPAEMWGLRHNIKLHCFDKDYSQDRKDAYLMGAIDFGVYVWSCIQDVEDNPLNYTPGYISNITNVRNGKKPSTLSYGCGKQSYVNLMIPYFLGGRNSFHGNNTNDGFIDYNNSLTHNDFITRDSTTRFGYYTPVVGTGNASGTLSEGLAYVQSEINRAYNVNGWYTDFLHWHWLDNTDYLEQHLENIRNSIGVKNIYSGSYSDLVEYFYVRKSVTSISFNGLNTTINYIKNELTADYNLISTPLYFEVDLSSTSLNGKFIKCSDGSKVLSLGSDKYIIETPLNYANTSKSITFSEEINSNDYINLNAPIVSENMGVITSDQPIKITLFSKDLAQNEYDVVIEERELTLNTSHTLATTMSASKDYYIGFINEYGVSGVLEL